MSNAGIQGPFCQTQTTGGWVQGLAHSGVCHFRGLPYGASTAGARRFAPPLPVAPWRGIRECFGHGPVSPQLPTPLTHRYGRLIHLDRSTADGGIGEDCLHLNVWTPGLADGAQRPVLFCVHGGGFAIGSGNSPLYDGAELARRHDVVVVSVSHRLGALGFLSLADVSAAPEFQSAGSNGIRDLVLALEWVRDNALALGGDPGCVTVFGQSGGGWKTSVLLATPAARGLFHRAAVQSGSMLRLPTPEDGARLTAALLAGLGLAPASVSRLLELPWQALVAAQEKLGALNFMPVLDGEYLPHHPCDPAAPPESADVPLIVSTTLDDASLFFEPGSIDEAALQGWLATRYPDHAAQIRGLYRERWPDEDAFLVHARIVTDSGFRRFAHLHAERKAAQGVAPVYCYRWDWATPSLGGAYGAAHATDVAASLGNDRDAIAGGGAAPGRAICDALAASWVGFARRGDPKTAALPEWPPFEAVRRSTLILDGVPRVESDPLSELRLFWAAMPPAVSVFG